MVYLSILPHFALTGLNYPGEFQVAFLSLDTTLLIYYYDKSKNLWTNRLPSPTFLTEKSSGLISFKIKEQGPKGYELARRYSVIKFLLMKEILVQNHILKDILVRLVYFSD
jgi:hypothetical protein